ncbi:MAG: hypothetical protein ACFHWX_02825 [Bacteroidota bacterium]
MREIMLILHFLGLAMGLGTSFAFFFLGRTASKWELEERKNFMMKAFSISTMGHIGLALLFISGGYLMTPYWSILGSSPILITKLVLFLALGAFIGIISSKARKARKGDPSQMAKIPILGTIALITGIAIVICAVIFFK